MTIFFRPIIIIIEGSVYLKYEIIKIVGSPPTWEGQRQMQEDNNVQNDLSSAFTAFQQRQTGTGEQGSAQPSVEPAKGAQQPEPNPQEQPKPEEQASQGDPKNDNPTNQSFAKMRVENSNLNKKMNDISAVLKTMGYENVDDFIAKKAEEELKQSAQKNNVPVDLEKRIRQLEEENKHYREVEETNKLNRQVGSLVQKYNIDKGTFDNFIAYMQANGINPMLSGVPLETYFIQFNPDAVFQARLAEEKKKWEAEFTKGKDAPISTPQGQPAGNTQSNTNTKVDWRALAEKYKR